MNVGKRRPSVPSPGRLAALLVSVIALALAFFAVPAQAEECTSSSCVQYSPSLPKAEGEHTPTHKKQTPAKASKTGDGGGTSPSGPSGSGSNEAEESEEGESSREQGGVAAGNDDGTGQGKAGGSANHGENGANAGKQNALGKPASHSDDGGSSPLVPILIAIAVLAALSVAFVMIRQRRQRDGGGPATTASPEAN